MTTLIPDIRNFLYEDISRKPDLHSLRRRRVRGDWIQVYKWKIGINKADINKAIRIST